MGETNVEWLWSNEGEHFVRIRWPTGRERPRRPSKIR